MKQKAPNKPRQIIVLLLSTLLMTGALPLAALESGYYLAGLGLHQETGRDIYLGGIYLKNETPRPASLEQLPDSRVMEYRIVARRTSIRSLLGGMLLQSEVATGEAPSAATGEFATALLSRVTGSLYAGDSLEIRLSEQGETIALLNGHELARVASTEVANYLLVGWVNESGPSALFRNKLMATEIDPSLLEKQQATTFSAEREAQVAAWSYTPLQGGKKPRIAAVGTQGDSGTAAITDTAALGEDIQASAALTENQDSIAAGSQQESATSDISSLGVQEYSQRLSDFHGALVAMVYREIKYPKRAVRRGLHGRLELDITLSASGELITVTVAESTGHQILDAAAIKAAEKALSAPAFKTIDPVAIAEFGRDSNNLVVPVPVNFKLME